MVFSLKGKKVNNYFDASQFREKLLQTNILEVTEYLPQTMSF